ncbi:hypothetical protein Acr_05g0002450 [Actinidia rufa]|uniref:Uncharacterized protein n=1 Tax=Actinidia rufa TaxID=165716 RepID=A0A7J0EK76_9ERIC|nr:hypothetical protein Acr_05g0002450 [Actinidia rufa]
MSAPSSGAEDRQAYFIVIARRRPFALTRQVFNVSSPSSDAENHRVYFIAIARWKSMP